MLDLLVDVLSLLPSESVNGLTHRMGDFEQVLRCVDHVLGTSGGDRLAALETAIAEDVLDVDPVATALLAAVDYDEPDDYHGGNGPCGRRSPFGSWALTELLDWLGAFTSDSVLRSSSWPKTPGILTMHLNRLAPALLEAHAIRVTTELRQGEKRRRVIEIAKVTDDEA